MVAIDGLYASRWYLVHSSDRDSTRSAAAAASLARSLVSRCWIGASFVRVKEHALASGLVCTPVLAHPQVWPSLAPARVQRQQMKPHSGTVGKRGANGDTQTDRRTRPERADSRHRHRHRRCSSTHAWALVLRAVGLTAHERRSFHLCRAGGITCSSALASDKCIKH